MGAEARAEGNNKIKLTSISLAPEIERVVWISLFLMFESVHNQMHSLNEVVVFYTLLHIRSTQTRSHITFLQVVPYQ